MIEKNRQITYSQGLFLAGFSDLKPMHREAAAASKAVSIQCFQAGKTFSHSAQALETRQPCTKVPKPDIFNTVVPPLRLLHTRKKLPINSFCKKKLNVRHLFFPYIIFLV